MKTFIVENTWNTHREQGWGNGYLVLPPSSPWYGVSCEHIPVSVHGGLNWSSISSDMREEVIHDDIPNDHWIIGFHTSHYGDTPINCGKDYVESETSNLYNQMLVLNQYKVADSCLVAYCPHCNLPNDVVPQSDCSQMNYLHCIECENKFYYRET